MSQTTIVVAQSTTTEAPAAGEQPAAAEAPAAAGETGHTTEGTAAEGGHGAFPPMDAHSFPSQIFWLVIFFALLYVLMSKVALPKMAAVLAKRSSVIEGDLARAQALKDETQAAVASYEKALADARAKAQGIAAETRAKVTSEIDAEQSALDKTLAAKIAEAEAKIAAAKASALKDVNDVAADSAADIVNELTGAGVSKDDALRAVSALRG